VHAALALPGLAAIVAANAALLGEFARLDALPPWLAAVVAFALTVLPLRAMRPVVWKAALAIGLVGALAPLVVVGVVTTAPPWTAWQRVASRPAFVFEERSEWVTGGRVVAQATTLAFDEPQRVTAITNDVWRVTERDGERRVTRERRVAVGETVVFRPGDQLAVAPGARLRFEAGKRADPAARRGLTGALLGSGLVVGFLGAAIALVPPMRGVRAAPAFAAALPLVFGTTAVVSGVYAMYVAPDIALGATPATVLHGLPRAVLPGAAAAPLVAASGIAVLALHAASAASLLARVRAALPGAAGTSAVAHGVWVAIATVAAGAVLSGITAATWLTLGVGLLASSWTAPLLAGAPSRATTAGAAVGLAVFVLAVAVGTLSGVEILRDQAVILAAPAAWAVAAALGRADDDRAS
jgi:hypothetical protein